jgi:hypothetical protein
MSNQSQLVDCEGAAAATEMQREESCSNLAVDKDIDATTAALQQKWFKLRDDKELSLPDKMQKVKELARVIEDEQSQVGRMVWFWSMQKKKAEMEEDATHLHRASGEFSTAHMTYGNLVDLEVMIDDWIRDFRIGMTDE